MSGYHLRRCLACRLVYDPTTEGKECPQCVEWMAEERARGAFDDDEPTGRYVWTPTERQQWEDEERRQDTGTWRDE